MGTEEQSLNSAGTTENEHVSRDDNVTINTTPEQGHPCCFIYFGSFSMLILTLCIMSSGIECQVLADHPKCIIYREPTFDINLATSKCVALFAK